MLLGFRDAELALDVDRLARRVAARRLPRRAGSPRDRRSADAARRTRRFRSASCTRPRCAAPVHSLYHPRLNFEAGSAFFVGAPGRPAVHGLWRSRRDRRGQLAAAALSRARRRRGPRGDPRRDRRACLLSAAAGLRRAMRRRGRRCEPEVRGVPDLRRDDAERSSGPLFMPPDARAARQCRPRIRQRRIRPAAAVDLTRLFIEEYAHAAPLDPSALLGFWERCGVNPAGVGVCRPGLRTRRSA